MIAYSITAIAVGVFLLCHGLPFGGLLVGAGAAAALLLTRTR